MEFNLFKEKDLFQAFENSHPTISFFKEKACFGFNF